MKARIFRPRAAVTMENLDDWKKLRPHVIPRKVMQKIAKGGFKLKSAMKIKDIKHKKITEDTLAGYRSSWEASIFLSHQKKAWPNVSEGDMYDIVSGSNFMTYIHRDEATNEIDAAAVLKYRTESGRKFCWLEFVRGLPTAPLKKGERPIPKLMRTLDEQLGCKFDKILLQVHSTNKHAVDRFKAKYGFTMDKEYDDKKYNLIGMCKVPMGEAAVAARARRRIEARDRERVLAIKREREEESLRKFEVEKRPKRDCIGNPDYKEKDEPRKIQPYELVGSRVPMSNWAAAKVRASKKIHG